MKNKKSQLKIQEMAFMIVAVVLLFSLVALFALSIFFKNLHENATKIAESRTLSAITNLADSPEFSCVTYKSNCVDADKLIALVNTTSYQEFWPFSSLKVVKLGAFLKNEDEMIKCNFANYAACTNRQGAGFSDSPKNNKPGAGSTGSGNGGSTDTGQGSQPAKSCSKTISGKFVSATKGESAKVSAVDSPGDFSTGDRLTITNLNGHFSDPNGISNADCSTATGPQKDMTTALGRFYSGNKKIGNSYELINMQDIEVPLGADNLIVYFIDGKLSDNTGGCSFEVEIKIANCSETPDLPPANESEKDEFENLYGDVPGPSYTSSKSCKSDCELFIVYDKHVKNERSISSYIALCRKEYENGYTYDKCELAKLVAGTEQKNA